ncbi:MAG: HEAT repeat domain-containing protein [Planctomycetota bacterium]|nr:HEAT repeat domain-containing protein [Planctomycetota bacterium]
MSRWLCVTLFLLLPIPAGSFAKAARSDELQALVKKYEAELLKVKLRPALPPLPGDAEARPGRRPGRRPAGRQPGGRVPPNRKGKQAGGKRLALAISAVKPILRGMARLEEKAAFDYLALQWKDGPAALKPVVTAAIVSSEDPRAPAQVFIGFSRLAVTVRLAALEALHQRRFTQFWREHLVRVAPTLKSRDCLVAAVPLLAQVKTLASARQISAYLSHDVAETNPDTELGDLAVTALFGMAADEEITAWLKAEAFAMEELTPTRLYVYVSMAGGLQLVKDRKRLVRYMKHDFEPIVIAATASLVQLGTKDGAREVLRLLARRRGYELISYRIKLLDAIARAATSSSVEILAKLLKSKDEDLRAVALGSLGVAAANKDALKALVGGLMDKNARVRASALRSLEGVVKRVGGSNIMIAPLIEYLDLEKQYRLRIDALNLLVRVSGHNMGLVPEDWRKWWENEKGRFVAQSSLEAAQTAVKAHDLSYFGIEITSKRIAFLLDVSNSMLAKARGPEARKLGLSKLDVMKAELAKVVEKLPLGAGINIMIFDRTVRVWEKSLKILTRAVRKKALAYAKGLTTGGGTNIFDTVERALKDPLVDTIYLLTDGAATTGRFKDADGMLAGIREFNRTRGITIHCIAFGREVEWMRKCAEQNGGKYRYVAE